LSWPLIVTCVPTGPDAGRSFSWGSPPGYADAGTALDVAGAEGTPGWRTGAEDDAPGGNAELAHPAASTSDAATPRPGTSRFHMTPPAAR